jgi:predicted RNase H-like HicB family nuclease
MVGPSLGIARKPIMATKRQLTAIIEKDKAGYTALCPELDVASQGQSVEEARENLTEAVELFLETADPREVEKRLHGDVFITRLEVMVG